MCSSLHTKIVPTTYLCALLPGSLRKKNLLLSLNLSLYKMFDKPTYLDEYLSGNMTVDEALKAAEDDLKNQIGNPYQQ